ncbi:neuroligin-4, Y-linked isoform X2 [Uranotaenia lowii]|uniref:neuroligin-4, Y-linked isoform X2 n=1 Tax=Uranotaenia lowii TaxID=190385 RepID=UPI0024792910|nr:neuroligin-4, Y-linked isoform X2 [Uranotaenia lowii]
MPKTSTMYDVLQNEAMKNNETVAKNIDCQCTRLFSSTQKATNGTSLFMKLYLSYFIIDVLLATILFYACPDEKRYHLMIFDVYCLTNRNVKLTTKLFVLNTFIKRRSLIFFGAWQSSTTLLDYKSFQLSLVQSNKSVHGKMNYFVKKHSESSCYCSNSTPVSIEYFCSIYTKRYVDCKKGIDYIYKETKTKFLRHQWRKFRKKLLIIDNKIDQKGKQLSIRLNGAFLMLNSLIISKDFLFTLVQMYAKSKLWIILCINNLMSRHSQNFQKSLKIRYLSLLTNRMVSRRISLNVHCSKHVHICVLAVLIFAQIDTLHGYQYIKYSSNIIKTKYGPLRGIVVKSNPVVEAFLGVPYASPPVGSLRYMPPVTPSTWKTIRLADSFSPVCPQLPPNKRSNHLFEVPQERLHSFRRLLPLLMNQSEDCLYLNLYVPRSDDNVSPNGSPKATIVYIQGESYEWNSGNPYDGSVLAADGDVIFVTLNFRLGVLGFLKTGAKGSAQGNFGLMDLVAALHWLRENLSFFYGDPSRITLMGHGTGAALANILVVSPVASDLMQRVILLSGSALSPWAIQKDPFSIKKIVADQASCHIDILVDDLAPCLRRKTLAELLEISPEFPRFLTAYAPFIDGTVIVNPNHSNVYPPRIPTESAITSTQGFEFTTFPKQELLFGVTSFESFNELSAQDLEFGINETRRDRILRTYVRNVFHYHMKEIYSALKNEYTDWEHSSKTPLEHRDTILELLSDGYVAAPLVRLAYLHSLQKGQSYFVHFRHQSTDRKFPERGGSVHGEDVPFTFGLPLSPLFSANYTVDDAKISKIMVKYLSNFAKSGNPNNIRMSSQTNTDDYPMNFRSQNFLLDLPTAPFSETFDELENYKNDKMDDTIGKLENWNMYDYVNQNYLELGCNVVSKSHYKGHKLSMWLNLIPQLHAPEDSIYLPVRHHHFADVKSNFYEGRLKPLTLNQPSKLIPTTRTKVQIQKSETNMTPLVQLPTSDSFSSFF